jgi:3-mercaptopyruvate sulfurtransferase SseA
VFNLDGGLNGWTKDNLPLARESNKGTNSKPGSK